MKRILFFLLALLLAVPASATRVTLTNAGTRSFAFPVFMSSASTAIASNITTTVNLPGTYAGGDLLLMFLKTVSTALVTTPTGWTLQTNSSGAGCGPTLWVYYKTSDGTEGSTVSVTQDAANSIAFVTFAIRNWSGTLAGTNSVSSSNPTPNPPSLTSGFGAVPTMWFAAVASNTATLNTYPSGYSNGTVSNGGSANFVAAATLTNSNASEDPGAFGSTGATAACVNTFAIKGP